MNKLKSIEEMKIPITDIPSVRGMAGSAKEGRGFLNGNAVLTGIFVSSINTKNGNAIVIT